MLLAADREARGIEPDLEPIAEAHERIAREALPALLAEAAQLGPIVPFLSHTARPDTDAGVATETRNKEKLAKPPLYKVLFHNDNYTTMEFVVAVLRDVTEGVARLPRLEGAEADPSELLFGSDADLDRLEWGKRTAPGINGEA